MVLNTSMHQPRLLPALVVLTILLSSCTLFGATDTTAGDGSPLVDAGALPTEVTTLDPAASISVEVDSCSGADEHFAILCEAHDILTAFYVGPLDDADLSAGAIQGLQEYELDAAPLDTGELACAVPSDDFSDFCDLYATIQATDGATDSSLVDAAIQGMMDFGIDDRNSNYFDEEEYTAFNEDHGGQVHGIGALVNSTNIEDEAEICTTISATCKMEIVSPLQGSPAEATDIRAGDFIITVDGENIEGHTLNEVVAIVRGPAGSEVLLGIERGDELLEKLVVRAAVDIPVTTTEMLTDTVGLLLFYSFTSNSDELFRASLQELLDQGMETLILDLQGNPGGSLDAAVNIASEFLSEGLVVAAQALDQVFEYEVRPGGLDAAGELEIYILINEGSASASEVLAGALQDNGRATLVGQNSFGKNTVQRLVPLSNGGGLKVTTARWVTTNGNDFGEVGITPDIEISYPEDLTGEELRDFLRNEVLKLIEGQ